MRVRLGLAAVTMVGLSLPGSAVRADNRGREAPVLRAVWVDTSNSVDAGALMAEAKRLFAAMGVELEMRVGTPAGMSDPSVEIRVVGLPNDRAHRTNAPLGETPSGRASTVWVDYGRVAEILRQGSGYPPTARVLATAAGRVAAHELVHAVAPERGHARFGLMAPRFGVDALEGATLVVDATTRRAVGRHLTQPVVSKTRREAMPFRSLVVPAFAALTAMAVPDGVTPDASTAPIADPAPAVPAPAAGMHRFMVVRTFAPGALAGLDAGAKEQVNRTNSRSSVRWIHSFANAEKTRTFCIYEGPSEKAIREAATANKIPVDDVVEIPLVLNPK